jgi:aryl-alcohol dehydrogenase-like predicted oxidoreductase
MIRGFATPEPLYRFAKRHPESKQFYRKTQSLTVSSLGLGTYLGGMDAATDLGYEEAVAAAIGAGINCIDTSLNYRNQRSERAIGRALARLFETGVVEREQVVVSTKAGYLVPGAVPETDEIEGKMHCMTPEFLADQLLRSQANLQLETIDVFYLHNPETQLRYVGTEVFYERIRRAFDAMEGLAEKGGIRFYGAATWTGFREPDQLSLERMVEIARCAGGNMHRFRFIQIPLNLAMPEAFTRANADGKTILDVAQEENIAVVASASLMQGRLSAGLPEEISARFPGLESDALRSIQFVRSTPGVVTALVGMSDPRHVRENASIARVAPMGPDGYFRYFRK